MARVTDTEVKKIIITTTDTTPFITVANQIVTEKISGESTLDDARLKEIEKWLAAHFVASTIERQAKSEKTGNASIVYMGGDGLGLDATTYGQQVKVLDTTGTLAQIGKRKARVDAIEAIDVS